MIDPDSGQEILLTRPSKLGIALKRAGLWVFAASVVVMVVVYVLSGLQAKVYTATGSIFVTEGATANAQDVQTIAQLVSSDEVLRGVTGLSLGTVQKEVSIAPAESENVVNITVTAPSPSQAVNVVNAVYGSFQAVEAQVPVSQQRTTYLSTPAEPGSPSAPRPLRNAGVGFVLAVLLGVGVVWLREVRRPTAADTALVAERLGVPMFADLSESSLLRRRGPAARERAFVALSLDLDELAPKGTRVLCLAGVRPGDLDTGLPLGLARAFAGGGWRVVLVDGDPSGTLSRQLRTGGGEGLTDLPGRDTEISSLLKPTDTAGLAILPHGRRGFDRAQQNLSSELHRIFDHLVAANDLVIVAVPDVSEDASARLLAAACQGLVLVVAGSTPIAALEAAQLRLSLFRATLIGFVRDESRRGLLRRRERAGTVAARPAVDRPAARSVDVTPVPGMSRPTNG